MNHISEIAEKALAQASSQKVAPTPLTTKQTSQLFHRLQAIYGHKFSSLFPSTDLLAVAKQEWADSLAGLSSFQINQGLDKCRKLSEWNPNIPEFIRLATGLPSQGLAEERVIKQKAIDPVSRRIMLLIGCYDLRNKSTKELRKQIANFYQECYEYGLSEVWGANQNWQPPEQLEQQQEKDEPVNKELGEQSITKIKDSLK